KAETCGPWTRKKHGTLRAAHPTCASRDCRCGLGGLLGDEHGRVASHAKRLLERSGVARSASASQLAANRRIVWLSIVIQPRASLRTTLPKCRRSASSPFSLRKVNCRTDDGRPASSQS